MLGALGLLLSVHIRQLENFAGTMNFVIFPMFFLSTALYPLWKLRESGARMALLAVARQPVHPRGRADPLRRLRQARARLARGLLVCGVVCFIIATIGYDPQRGLLRRAPQTA